MQKNYSITVLNHSVQLWVVYISLPLRDKLSRLLHMKFKGKLFLCL